MLFSFQVMIRNGVEPKEAMAIFFDCLERCREIEQSVSDEERRAAESPDDNGERVLCARQVKDAQAQMRSIIKRFWLPHWSACLSEACNASFRRRMEGFLRNLL